MLGPALPAYKLDKPTKVQCGQSAGSYISYHLSGSREEFSFNVAARRFGR
jgi:hypothetical protein